MNRGDSVTRCSFFFEHSCYTRIMCVKLVLTSAVSLGCSFIFSGLPVLCFSKRPNIWRRCSGFDPKALRHVTERTRATHGRRAKPRQRWPAWVYVNRYRGIGRRDVADPRVNEPNIPACGIRRRGVIVFIVANLRAAKCGRYVRAGYVTRAGGDRTKALGLRNCICWWTRRLGLLCRKQPRQRWRGRGGLWRDKGLLGVGHDC
jgi:hypothetical protein